MSRIPKEIVAGLVFVAFLFFPLIAYSLPQGEEVVAGSATFDRSKPDTLKVNVATEKMIANYNSFSIGSSEAVHFLQPSAASVALNRVVGGDLSSIFGTLTANGRIFLVNPNGVLFGPGCHVDTAGLLASTLNIKDSDFLAGRYTFIGPGGAVVNQGYINTPGGYVALLGSSVANTGVIEAELGSVVLASGEAMTLNLDPQGLISVVLDQATTKNLTEAKDAVKNSGTIKADGGKVVLTAKTLGSIFKNAVNNEGIIEADALNNKAGAVELTANAAVSSTGDISAKGGTIKICTDDKLTLAGNYTADKILFDPAGWVTQTGVINLGGDTTFWTPGDIDVLFDIINNGGLTNFYADNASDVEFNFDNGVGNFTQAAGTTISAHERVAITGANVTLNPGSKITVTPDEEGGHSASIEIYAHGGLTADNYSGVIDVNNADLSATVPGEGDSHVFLFAGNYTNVPHDFDNVEGDDGIIEKLHGNGSINIHGNSNILASIGSGYDAAEIRVEAQDITIDNSDITSEVTGDGRALLGISAGGYDFYHQFNVFRDRVFDGGDLAISNGSSILSTTGSNVDVWRDNFLSIDAGNIEISGASSVTAESKASGQAEVDMTAYDHFQRIDDRDYPIATGGTLDILSGSSILAQSGGSGNTDIEINSGSLSVGTININAGSVISRVMDDGDSSVNISSGNLLSNNSETIWNFYGGDLNILNLSTVLAEVQGNGEAGVDMNGGKIVVDNSSVKSHVLGDGDAYVGIFAGDTFEHPWPEEAEDGENYYEFSSGGEDPGTIDLQNLASVEATVDGEGQAMAELRASGDTGIVPDGPLSIKVTLDPTGGITLNNSSVKAQALGGGSEDAEVIMSAGHYHDFEKKCGFTKKSETGGAINILNNSNVLAKATSYADYANVDFEARDITVDKSSIKAEVGGDGYANVYLGAGDWRDVYGPDFECYSFEGGILNILNGSSVSATVAGSGAAYFDMDALDINISGSSANASVANGYAEIYAAVQGNVTIDPSNLTVLVNGDGEADLDFNMYGKEGDATITDSTLIAKVTGEGHAEVDIYNDENNEFWSGMLEGLGSMFSDSEDGIGGPINGSINITNSTLHAEAASTNSFSLDSKPETAIIGLISNGPINVVNSELSANELNGPALVGLLSNSYINVDKDSTLSATTSGSDSIAAVGLLAMCTDENGNSINAAGKISANGGDGLGVALLGGLGNIFAADVHAKGGFDTIGFLEDFFNYTFLNDSDYWLSIGAQYKYGSAALIGSLCGDITLGNVSADLVGVATLGGSIYQFQSGLIGAHLLGLLAAGDIGTAPDVEVDNPGPINTDVDILTAFSWDIGSIFINELNDLEVGLYLPIYTNYFSFDPELEQQVIVTEQIAAIGASVAANDGIVHIVSNNDMLVNSIIAPRAGVFLQSLHGSIFAGHAIDPIVSCSDIRSISGLIKDGLDSLGLDVCYWTIKNAVKDAMMDVSDTQWSDFFDIHYFSPVQFQCGISDGEGDGERFVPNVIAGGYSYFSTPEGTIGSGTPLAKDPAISGEIFGIVDPGVEAITGVFPSPGIDLTRFTPPGLVYFYNEQAKPSVAQVVDDGVEPYFGNQIWPVTITDPPITSGNPLQVVIVLNPPLVDGDSVEPQSLSQELQEPDTRALPDWFLNSPSFPGNDGLAALTLEIGPPPNQNFDLAGEVASGLAKYVRAYYEILQYYRVETIEPVTPTTFYGYHPLTPTDLTAFDNIKLDINAYNFIEDNLNLKKKAPPYYGEL